jgi:hypothetical protein
MLKVTPRAFRAASVKSLAPWEWDEPAPVRVSTNPSMPACHVRLVRARVLVLSNYVAVSTEAYAKILLLVQCLLLA